MYLGPRLGIDFPHRLGCHCGRQFVGRGSCWIETTEEWSRVLVQGGSERLRPMCVELVAMINWIGRSVGFSVFKNHLTAELGRLSPWQGDEKSVARGNSRVKFVATGQVWFWTRLGGANLQTKPPVPHPNPLQEPAVASRQSDVGQQAPLLPIPDHTHHTYTEVSLVNRQGRGDQNFSSHSQARLQ